ncbi:hypothetical protein E1176_01640 [Fulvivirga sp. RKSG066]|nr:hypothetical protein [Fulvivirga aurantia]
MKESYCHIYFNHEEEVLYAEWIGFLKADQVQVGCKAMTDYIKKNKVKTHLSDHRKLRVLAKEVQGYLTEEWFPEVESNGLRRVAVLVSDDVFAKATVDKVNTTAKVGQLVIKTFNAPKDCINWLSEVKAEV